MKGAGLIDMERKGSELIIHDHDRDLSVTLVGLVDVPYSDWGDFRRRRAVDISSCNRRMAKSSRKNMVWLNYRAKLQTLDYMSV